MTERLLNVTLAQIEQTNNPDENLELMVGIINQVRTDFLVFPETQLSGLDQESDLSWHTKVLAEKAQKADLWLVYGSYQRTGESVFNSARIIDSNGKTRLIYYKNNLWGEQNVTAGVNNRVLKTDRGNLGLVICWDLAHPRAIRQLTQGGVDLVFCPSYWFGEQFGTTQVIDNLPLVRAFENQVYLAYCDAYTKNGETASRSKICSPLKVLAQAEPQQKQLITADVDLSKLDYLRETFNCWKEVT